MLVQSGKWVVRSCESSALQMFFLDDILVRGASIDAGVVKDAEAVRVEGEVRFHDLGCYGRGDGGGLGDWCLDLVLDF